MIAPVSHRGPPAPHTGNNSETDSTPNNVTSDDAAFKAVEAWGSQNYQTNKQRLEESAKQLTEKKDDDDS